MADDAVLVVLTKAVVGRDDDMDDWYTNIHMRDALRFRGSFAAQRFRLSPRQPSPPPTGFDWQYLAFYDVFDPERFSREHWDNALTTRMMVSDAIDDSVLNDYHYYPLQSRNNDPEASHDQSIVVLEQLRPAEGQERAFESWYNDTYLPQLMRRPGVATGSLLVFRSFGQMIPSRPDQSHVGIYRVSEDALSEWNDGSALRQSPLVDQSALLVTAWNPITPRITEDAVQHPTATSLAEEERARLRMGDRVRTGGREKLGPG